MTAILSDQELDIILKKDFTNVFRSEYFQVKGVTMPRRFEEMQDDILKWDVKQQDVWICSFPKTGR